MAAEKKEETAPVEPLYLPNESVRGREGRGPWLDDIHRQEELAYRERRMGLKPGSLGPTEVPGLVTADKLLDNDYGAREAAFRGADRPGHIEAAAETVKQHTDSDKFANPVK